MGRHMGQGTEGKGARGAWGVVFPGPVRQIPPLKAIKIGPRPPVAHARPFGPNEGHGVMMTIMARPAFFFWDIWRPGRHWRMDCHSGARYRSGAKAQKASGRGALPDPRASPRPARRPRSPRAAQARRMAVVRAKERAGRARNVVRGGGGIRVGGNRRGAGRGWSAAGRWAGAMGRVSRVCRPWGARGAGRARGGVGWGEKVRYDVILIEICILLL